MFPSNFCAIHLSNVIIIIIIIIIIIFFFHIEKVMAKQLYRPLSPTNIRQSWVIIQKRKDSFLDPNALKGLMW